MVFAKRTLEPASTAQVLGAFGKVGRVVRAIRSGRLTWAFSEKIMLAVTSQLDCRYCQWFHSDLALQAGVAQEEIDELLAGKFNRFDESEQDVLNAAVEYAATGGIGQPAMLKLAKNYPHEVIEDIQAVLELIMATNLLGNTFDSFINRAQTGQVNGLASLFEGSVFLLTLPMYTGISIATSQGKNPFASLQA